MANEYVTLDEFKMAGELKGLAFMDYDATRSIASASRAIDEYCGRRFWKDADATQVRYYTPLDSRCVSIDDAVSVGTVQVDWDGDGTFETTLTTSDYTLDPLNAAADGKPYEEIRIRPWTLCLPYWNGCVKVTGQFGWSAVPDQVKTATMLLSEKLVKRVREAPFGVVGVGADSLPVRVIRTDPEMATLLDPLVRGQGVMVA